ncbi:hypothetical protein ACFQL0_00785 [Haloplanus litoreus]
MSGENVRGRRLGAAAVTATAVAAAGVAVGGGRSSPTRPPAPPRTAGRW